MGARTSGGRISRSRDIRLVPYGILLIILVVAGGLRWYGLAWDDGYLFHPDEREILLVASNLNLPQSVPEFFSTSSPLNPHFFAYGSLPIYLLRLIAPLAPPTNITGPWADDSLARWVFFGRWVSGLFDLGSIVLTFLLGRRLYNAAVGVIAAACVAVTVLHIQLSHFYAVDTLLTFFVLATLYAAIELAEGPTRFWRLACGVMFGLSLATKLSSLPLVFPIVFALWHASGIFQDEAGVMERVGARRAAPLRYASEVWRGIRRPFLRDLRRRPRGIRLDTALRPHRLV